MHPAPSIILFTSLSGLGFGLLFFLGLGMPGVTGWVAFAFFGIAYVLAVGGLLFSTLHLGHPERAWKAFSQWRSSWLSREGVAAVFTLVLMAIYGAGLVFLETRFTVLGWLGSLGAVATVFTTSMIYTQLKTVPRWNHWSTPVLFIGYAFTGGAMLAGQVELAAPCLILLGIFQLWSWQNSDGRFNAAGHTTESATGLGTRGSVKAFEPPHTGTNYLLHEMVHVVGRRHAMKLRIISFVLFAMIPWIILFVLPFSHFLAVVAILSHIAGVLTARWLFFAEAEHVVGLYYGKR